jgi:hypothetical protein
MPLAPICILYCKQCITMNEYRICWFSRFGFPGEKYLCNVCIFHCIFFCSFIENLFAVKYCTRLKSTSLEISFRRIFFGDALQYYYSIFSNGALWISSWCLDVMCFAWRVL